MRFNKWGGSVLNIENDTTIQFCYFTKKYVHN